MYENKHIYYVIEHKICMKFTDKIFKFCACYVLFQRITFKSMVLSTRPLPSSSSFPSVVRYTSVEMFWKMVLEQQSFPEKKFRVLNIDSLKPWIFSISFFWHERVLIILKVLIWLLTVSYLILKSSLDTRESTMIFCLML